MAIKLPLQRAPGGIDFVQGLLLQLLLISIYIPLGNGS